MTTNSTNKDFFRSITCTRSSSPIIINNKHKTNSLLSSCCTCSRIRQKSQQLNPNIQSNNGIITIEDTKLDVHKGFFKRIQCFKGLKIILIEINFCKNFSIKRKKTEKSYLLKSPNHFFLFFLI
jgi:hypothetical protein